MRGAMRRSVLINTKINIWPTHMPSITTRAHWYFIGPFLSFTLAHACFRSSHNRTRRECARARPRIDRFGYARYMCGVLGHSTHARAQMFSFLRRAYSIY